MTALLNAVSNIAAIEQGKTRTFVSGQGAYVRDADGKEYIEGMAGLWCTALGYGNEELAEAAAEQLRTFSYCQLFAGKRHPTAIDLADRLAAMVPVTGAHVFFGNSGSDANDTLFKFIKFYFNAIGQPQKKKIIVRQTAYHGTTVATAALTGLLAFHQQWDLPVDALGILRVSCPHYWKFGLPGEGEEAFAGRMVDEIEQLILREGPETIAAFFAEPLQGAGGVVLPPRGYFERLQPVLARHGILLVDDEVICGFGRTGNDFGATTYGMQPHMMTLAKALTSAYVPLSAAVVPGFMYEALVDASAKLGNFAHGYTYSGHPLACAVALRTLEIYARDHIFARAGRTGEYFQARLQALAAHPLVGEARGVGLVCGIELAPNKSGKKLFADGRVGQYCMDRGEHHGLICRAIGNTIALCPPLVITVAQVDEIFDKLTLALDDTLAFARREGLF